MKKTDAIWFAATFALFFSACSSDKSTGAGAISAAGTGATRGGSGGTATAGAGGPTATGLLVSEVWNSKGDQEAFMASRLGPALGVVGLPAPSQIIESEVEGFFTA